MKTIFVVITVCSLTGVLATTALCDDDWGDAPVGSVAYPSTGVIGGFPTCQNVPINFYITHGALPPQWTFFGPQEDYEREGNGGQCPTIPILRCG